MKRKRLFSASLLSGVCLLAFVLSGRGQERFAYEASLDSIVQPGFYKIVLMPEVVAKCKKDLSDLRIRDDHGQYVPYVLQSDFPVFSGEKYIEFPILPVKKRADSAEDVQIVNWSSGAIHSLLLGVRAFNA